MKSAIYFIAFLTLTLSFAQSNQNVVNNSGQALAKSGNAVSAYGAPAAMFYNPDTKTEGSVHLFDNWNNSAVIYTSVNHHFSLKNINLNIEQNTFESKISDDSIFSFNFDNVDKFVINGRIFKNYNYGKHNKVFEILFDSGEIALFKGFNVQFIKGSSNPMLNRSTNKYVKTEKYFIKKEGKITILATNKSRFLKAFNLEEPQKIAVLTFIKENNLSFKNEDHLIRIFKFIYR